MLVDIGDGGVLLWLREGATSLLGVRTGEQDVLVEMFGESGVGSCRGG